MHLGNHGRHDQSQLLRAFRLLRIIGFSFPWLLRKVNASPSIVGFVRDAVKALKNISSCESAERVSNNPMEFYFSDDPKFIEQNNRLKVKRIIAKKKWKDDIVPILRWMEYEGIEEIVPVLHSTELVPEKRLELADIMTERFEAFLYFFASQFETEQEDEEDEEDEEMSNEEDELE